MGKRRKYNEENREVISRGPYFAKIVRRRKLLLRNLLKSKKKNEVEFLHVVEALL